MEVLKKCLEKIMGWKTTSKLKLRLDETEVCLVNDKTDQGIKNNPEEAELPVKECFHSLRVLL